MTQPADHELTGRMLRAYNAMHSVMQRAEPMSGPAADLSRTLRASLLAIDQRPGLSPSALAQALGVTPAAVSPTMRQLTGRGLIERTVDPRDARAAQLYIAPAGRGIVAVLRARVEQAVDEILGPLAPQERAQLVGLLERGLDLKDD